MLRRAKKGGDDPSLSPQPPLPLALSNDDRSRASIDGLRRPPPSQYPSAPSGQPAYAYQQQQQHQHQHQHSPQQQQYAHQQSYQPMPPQHRQQSPPPVQAPQQATMGRSQSAFNFIFNKAKAPFSSQQTNVAIHQNAGAMSSSPSLSSFPMDEGGGRYPSMEQRYHHAPQRSQAGGHPMSVGIPKSSSGGLSRHAAQGVQQPNRPSFGDEMLVSSPTKRSFFSRDRKMSSGQHSGGQVVNANQGGGSGSNSRQGGAYAHSPLSTRPNREAGAFGMMGAAFSKSQSDLHTREMSSPGSIGSGGDYPPLRAPIPHDLEDPNFLRSPSPNIAFSRSVDDLSQNTYKQSDQGTPTIRQPSPRQASGPSLLSSSHGDSSRPHGAHGLPGTWGEHGVMNPEWRPSDMGTLNNPQVRRGSPGPMSPNSPYGVPGQHARSESLVAQPPLSNVSMMQPSPSLQPSHLGSSSKQQTSSSNHRLQTVPDSRHQRKGSKLPSVQASSSTSSLGGQSNSLGKAQGRAAGMADRMYQNLRAGSSSSSALPSVASSASTALPATPPPLPQGAIHQGFLSRNANVSLSFAQLSEQGREKDISKGWKPYRAVLRDGKILFFKPPSSAADEVKMLFPSGLAKGNRGAGAADPPLDIDFLKKSGLGAQDLLAATSSSSTLPTTPPFLPTRSRPSGSPARSPGDRDELPDPQLQVANPAWAGFGVHPALVLVETSTPPPTWAARIQSANLDAYAHELIFATQQRLGPSDSGESKRSSIALVLNGGGMDGNMSSSPEEKEALQDLDPLISSGLYCLASTGSAIEPLFKAIAKWASVALATPDENDKGQAAASNESTELFHAAVRARLGRFLQLAPIALVDAAPADRSRSIDVLEGIARASFPESKPYIRALDHSATANLPATPPLDWLSIPPPDATQPRTELVDAQQRAYLAENIFLKLDPVEVAQQIQVFHAERLRCVASPRLTLGRFLPGRPDSGNGSIGGGASAPVSPGVLPLSSAQQVLALFSFNSLTPHFITKLILDQLLSRGGCKPSDLGHRRVALLRHWIRIGVILSSLGDVAGWVAVAAALCSRAISRLEESWRAVPAQDRAIVGKVWAPMLGRLGWVDGVQTPDSNTTPVLISSALAEGALSNFEGTSMVTIPYLGDAIVGMHKEGNVFATSMSLNGLSISENVDSATQLFTLVQRWASEWSGIPDEAGEITVPGTKAPIPEYQALWQTLHARQLALVTSGTAESARDRVASSLSLEPKSLGNLDLHYRPPLRDTLAFHAQAPLRFPEPLPHLGFGEYKLSRAREAALARAGGPLSPDLDGTITSRSHARATLQGSAFASGKSALNSSNGTGSRAAFASVTEWSPSLPEVRALSLVPFQMAAAAGSPTAPLSPSVGTSAGSGRLIRLGSDVIFRAVSGGADTSVPSSPRNSRRFSQDLATLTLTRNVTGGVRPTSLTSKRSSLPTSNRNSVVELAPPISVVVKAATLERLVDILVMDVHHINLEVGSSDGTLSPIRKSRLSMDLDRYRINFLATFRSLCSPIVLLDLLRKRFLGAINASREMGLPAQHRRASQFPSWSMAPASGALAVEPIDWEIVTRIRTGVAQVIRLWAKRFAQDFVDDDDLFVGALTFLADPSALARVGEAEEASEENAQIRKVTNALEEANKTLRAAVFAVNAGKEAPPRSAQRLAATSTPSTRPPHRLSVSDRTPSPISSASPLSTSPVIDIDSCTPVQLVEHFEMVAALFFEKVHERDLLIASEQLERQASSPTGWFVAAQPVYAAGDDETTPTNSMYKLLEFLRPVADGKSGGSATSNPHDAKYNSFWAQLPTALSQMGAAQRIITAWFGMQIIEPRIGLQRRQARIEKLLDAAWICRARMLRLRSDEPSAPPATSSPEAGSNATNAQAPFREATIASFLECAITGSLTSSESRAYHVAWQSVAAARNASGEGLADLIPPPETALTLLRDALDAVALSVTGVGTPTPDLGWLLCCLAETHTRPSDLDSGDSALVNFDRYRTAWNLIDSALRFRPFDPSSIDIAMARYNVLVHAVSKMVLDRRAVRDDAVLEASSIQPPPLHAAWRGRPFRPLVAFVIEQGEKGRRDRLAFEAAQAELRPAREAAAFEKAHASVAAHVPPGNGHGSFALQPMAQEKRTKRMTALFRGAVRPMGGLLSNSADKPDVRVDLPPRSAAELMTITAVTSKPALIVPCTDAQINVWSNGQRSFVFHLASVEGGIKLLLQAPSLSEMTEWVGHIERITKENAEARMAETRKAKGRKLVVGAPLYGIPLVTLVEREGRDVPLAIERLFAEVEARGLREVGIYRISGAKSAIQNVRDALNVQPAELIDLTQGDCADIHTITGATKQFFRDLPDPAIPFAFYHSFMEAERIPDNDARLYAMRDLVWDLPKPHFDLLRRTVEHLARVVEEGEHNLMAAHNLGLVFGPSLLNPPPTQGNISLAEGFGNIGKAAHIVKLLITTHEWLFEPEPELQPDELEEVAADDGDAAVPTANAALEEDDESDGAPVSPDVLPTLPSTVEGIKSMNNLVTTADDGALTVATPDVELFKTPLDGEFDLPVHAAANGDAEQPESATETETESEAERDDDDDGEEKVPTSSISASAPVIDLQLPSSSFSTDSHFNPLGQSAELPAESASSPAAEAEPPKEEAISATTASLSPPSTLRTQRKREYGRAREESIYLDAHDALETLSSFQVQGAARPSVDEDADGAPKPTVDAPSTSTKDDGTAAAEASQATPIASASAVDAVAQDGNVAPAATASA